MTSHTNAVFSAQPGKTYLNGIWWNTQWRTNGVAGGYDAIADFALGTD